MNRIGIIGAMEEEVAMLKGADEGCNGKEKRNGIFPWNIK